MILFIGLNFPLFKESAPGGMVNLFIEHRLQFVLLSGRGTSYLPRPFTSPDIRFRIRWRPISRHVIRPIPVSSDFGSGAGTFPCAGEYSAVFVVSTYPVS
jgi:hypothetical protein